MLHPQNLMAMGNKILSLFLCCAFTVTVNAQQILPNSSLNNDFMDQVKSLEEFQNRFNGAERKPGVTNTNDSISRRLNILNLFDFQMNKSGMNKQQLTNKLNCFVDSVLQNSYFFDALGDNLWSECKCRFKYKGANKVITLLLQKEVFENGNYRWALVGVKGLQSAGIINTERFFPISPVEHEIYFMGLLDLFNENPSHAFGYRSKSVKIDQLSVLLTLVQAGLIKFDLVENQTFHCLGVPGFVFTIKEKSGMGSNSGWLINSIQEMTSKQKITYLNNLFYNEK